MNKHLINRASSVSKMFFRHYFPGNNSRKIMERIQVHWCVRNARKSDRVKRTEIVAPTGARKEQKNAK